MKDTWTTDIVKSKMIIYIDIKFHVGIVSSL